MSDEPFGHMTVAEVLSRWPQTIPMFMRHRMACVGCVMAPFESLAEAVAIYDLPLPEFVSELQHAIQAEGQPMSDSTPSIDVRMVPPPQRHPLIFQTFESLAPGEGFVLINDHDPKPLYYQFAFERQGQFTWEYLEAGPKVWRVRIGRTVA